jgi:hypothetical protein
VLLVMLLALAPLWHFAPTKRQRLQARLRECAALNGLFVELRDLPLPPARLERMPAAERQVVYYGCRLRASGAVPTRRTAWYRVGDDWSCRDGRIDPPAFVEEIPDSVLAVDLGPASCGLYWREEGTEDDVVSLARRLVAWRDRLTPA